MARKIEKPAENPAPHKVPVSAEEAAAKDLGIEFPARDIVLAGEPVTVNEITFVQSLRLQHALAPVVAELEASVLADAQRLQTQASDLPTAAIPLPATDFDRALLAFSAQWDAAVVLIAAATGLTRERIESLDDADGFALLLAFWRVNEDFFLRRVVGKIQFRAAQLERSVGAKYSPRSAPTATAAATSIAPPSGS